MFKVMLKYVTFYINLITPQTIKHGNNHRKSGYFIKKYIARANISNPLITTLINEYKNASDIHEGSNIKGRKPVSSLLKKIIGI